jgi:hypothetical protein
MRLTSRKHGPSTGRRAVPDDAEIACPRLEPIERSLQIGRNGLCRPPVPDLSDLAGLLELLQPDHGLLGIQPSGFCYASGRVLPGRQLAERLLQAILVRLGRLICFGYCRLRNGRLGRLWQLPGRRRMSVPSSARNTHDNRLATFLTDNLKIAPSASGTADTAAASIAFDLAQVFIVRGHPV